MPNMVHAWNWTFQKQDFDRQGLCFSRFALDTTAGIQPENMFLHELLVAVSKHEQTVSS